jgi:hypothetical protein
MRNLDFVIPALADVADKLDSKEMFKEADDINYVLEMICKIAELSKESYVKKIKQKGKTKYQVKSEKNPNWNGGVYNSKEEAKDRLAEVEMFKHMKSKK